MIIYFCNYRKVLDLKLNKKIQFGDKGICRYCGKEYPTVKFSKIAHSFPELIGNKCLFSKDECDDCNSHFSQDLENHLSNFLGLHRTICQISGKKGVPKFKNDEGDRVGVVDNDIYILQSKDSEFSCVIDDKIKFTYVVNPYIPIKVYKCFVKMALSVMPKPYLSYYQECIKWVRYNITPQNFLDEYFKGKCTFIPGNSPFENIWVTLFKSTSEAGLCPDMLCYIGFSNFMFQFFVPFSENDKDLKAKDFNGINFKELEKRPPNQNGPSHAIDIDFKGTEPVKYISQAAIGFTGKWEEKTMSDIDEIPEKMRKELLKKGYSF